MSVTNNHPLVDGYVFAYVLISSFCLAGNHSCRSVQSHDTPSMHTPLPLYLGQPPEPTVAVHYSVVDERAKAVHAEIASSISLPHTHTGKGALMPFATA